MAETPAGYDALIERDWHVPQGADTVNAFKYGVQGTGEEPITYPDLSTGWSAQAQIRPAPGAPPWVIFSSESLSGPRIELGLDGMIYIVLPHDTTEDPAWNTRVVGFYDIELTSPADFKTRLAKGTVILSPDITREVS